MTKQNKGSKKKIIIFLFLFTFMISLLLYSFQPIVSSDNSDKYVDSDKYVVDWPIIDESDFNKTINNYEGEFDEKKFENIFESIITNSLGDEVLFEYLYNDKTIVNTSYFGKENIKELEHKYIFEVLENKDYN